MPNKRKDLKIKGANLWYLVGLITSDGCLSRDGRHIDITSKERDFLQQLTESLGISNKIGVKYNTMRQKNFHIQITNSNFYDFLISIGLIPNKSLTLERLKIADQYFVDFLRGLIDGDGSIRRWTHSSNDAEQWSLRIYSGSETFIGWLSGKIEQLLKIRGRIHNNASNIWVLKYGKMAARVIAEKCYYKKAFALARKKYLAQACADSCRGWGRSKTVFN